MQQAGQAQAAQGAGTTAALGAKLSQMNALSGLITPILLQGEKNATQADPTGGVTADDLNGAVTSALKGGVINQLEADWARSQINQPGMNPLDLARGWFFMNQSAKEQNEATTQASTGVNYRGGTLYVGGNPYLPGYPRPGAAVPYTMTPGEATAIDNVNIGNNQIIQMPHAQAVQLLANNPAMRQLNPNINTAPASTSGPYSNNTFRPGYTGAYPGTPAVGTAAPTPRTTGATAGATGTGAPVTGTPLPAPAGAPAGGAPAPGFLPNGQPDPNYRGVDSSGRPITGAAPPPNSPYWQTAVTPEQLPPRGGTPAPPATTPPAPAGASSPAPGGGTPAWAQPPPPPPTGGIYGGVGVTAAPQVQAEQTAAGTQSQAQLTSLQQQVQQVPQTKAILADMRAEEATPGFQGGIGAQTASTLNKVVQFLHLGDTTDYNFTDPQQAREAFKKDSSLLGQTTLKALGNSSAITDARQELTEASTPTVEMSDAGRRLLIHTLTGNQTAIQVMNNAWLQAQRAGWGPAQFGQWQQTFNDTDPQTGGQFDPRVYWLSDMTPQEQRDYGQKMKAASPADADQFTRNVLYARRMGWLSVSPTGFISGAGGV
jgi:hypothetical protein